MFEQIKHVFPACAGMFLTIVPDIVSWVSFPRVRGDVPARRGRGRLHITFSPRARGCSSRG